MDIKIASNRITNTEWLKYHPYNKSVVTDFYYLKICNKILDLIQISEYNNIFSPDEKIELSCIFSAYFEDVISESRIFYSFTQQHKKLYGTFLPFYEINSDKYYQDEVNLQDIAFIIWHWQAVLDSHDQEIVTDPFSPLITELSQTVYDLLESEFEKAPQNEEMQYYFTEISLNSSLLDIRERIEFLACNTYLSACSYSIFMDNCIKSMKFNKYQQSHQDRVDVLLYNSKMDYIFNETSQLLALYPSQELANILGENHPVYNLVQSISEKKSGFFVYQEEKEVTYIFEHVHSKRKIDISKENCNFSKNSLIRNQSIFMLNVVKWGDDWHLMGASIGYNEPLEIISQMGIGIGFFNTQEQKLGIVNSQQDAFLEVNKNSPIVYLSTPKELQYLLRKINFTQIKKTHPHLSKGEIEQYTEKFLDDIFPSMDDFDNVVVFFNPLGGIEFYPDFANYIRDKKNPFYNKISKCEIEFVLFENSFSKEFINYITENSLIDFRTDSEFKNEKTLSSITDNFDFLLKYYKRNSYWSKAQITIVDKEDEI